MTYDGRVMAAITVPSGVTLHATTNAGGPTSVAITAGTYESIVALCAQLQTDLTAGRSVSGGAWSVSVSTGPSGTGLVTVSVSAGTFVITWDEPNLPDVLGFAGNISATASATGADQARGLWMPACPLMLDGRYTAAPPVTDVRRTRNAAGLVLAHVGNAGYRHRNMRWTHVPQNRVWLADETFDNESLETFLMDTQWGQGHPWFSTASKCVIIAHDGSEIGGGTVAGWYIASGTAMDDVAQRRGDSWDGVWTVTFAELSTDS